jgi:hypothetical protein
VDGRVKPGHDDTMDDLMVPAANLGVLAANLGVL